MTNRFADAKDVPEVVFQAIGAGSVCWVGGTGPLEFDSAKANAVGREAVARINEVITESLQAALQAPWSEPL